MKSLLLILLIMFTLSCSLDRANPLDPLVSGVLAPEIVHIIHVSIPQDYSVTITWNEMPNVDGYYIYRSQSYDGLYDLITPEGIDFTEIDYEDSFEFNPEGFYWYKMSAYILVDDEKLEGYRSEPTTWNL